MSLSIEEELAEAQSIDDYRKAINDLQRRLAREREKTGTLVEAMRTAVKENLLAITIPPVPSPPSEFRNEGAEIAICLLSDWQLGKKTPTYDSETCEERIKYYCERADRILRVQRSDHPVGKCVLVLAGDMVEGEMIFPGQAHEIDSSLYVQAMKNGPRILSYVVRWASARFEQVEVYAVPGNHGAIGGRSRREYHPETNADRFLYEFTSALTTELRNVKWTIALDWYQLIDLGERLRMLAVHGDHVRGYNGIPWYGWTRNINQLSSLSRIWEEFDFDVVLAGHFHTPVSIYVNGRRLWINASTESHNPYALRQLGAAGEPAQWLLFGKPGKGITAEYLVTLR